MFKFRLTLHDFVCVCLGILLLANIKATKGFFDDPGIGWHLANGQHIYNTYTIPQVDTFLSISRPWVNDQWLGDLILFSLYKVGSWQLLKTVWAVFFWATLFVMLYRIIIQQIGSSLAATLTTIHVLIIAKIHFVLRPLVFSYLFFILCYYLAIKIYTLHRNNLPTPRKFYFYLGIIFVLWANIHPSFILGIIILGLASTAVTFELLLKNGKLSKNEIFQFFATLILPVFCLLCTAINPAGINLHQSIISLGSSKYFMNFNREWLGLNFKNAEGAMFMRFVLLIILGDLVLRKCTFPRNIFYIAGSIFFGYMSLKSIRFFPYFAIVASIPFAQAILNILNSRLFIRTKFLRNRLRTLSVIDQYELNSRAGALGLCLFIVISSSIIFGKDKLGETKKLFPAAEIIKVTKEVTSSRNQDPVANVMTHPNFGGKITWYSNSVLKPIIDDRNTLSGEKRYKQILSIIDGQKDYEQFFLKEKISYVMLYKKMAIIKDLRKDPNAKLLYEDKKFIAFQIVPSQTL